MSRNVARQAACAGLVSMVLSGCGGSGGGDNGGSMVRPVGEGGDQAVTGEPWPVDADSVRHALGAGAPEFAGSDVAPTLQRLVQSADSVIVSDVLVSLDTVPQPARGQAVCAEGGSCVVDLSPVHPVFSQPVPLSSADLDFEGAGTEFEAIASHRGVSLAQGRGPGRLAGTTVNRYGYGGWLEHSFFLVETAAVVNNPLLPGANAVFGYTAGDATGTNPGPHGSATWSGVVVGQDISGTDARGDRVQGDAEISIADFADPTLEIAFTGVRNLVRGSEYADMRWSGVEMTSGAFDVGSDGDSIAGRFYGPTHAEVGGVFERNDILGAFGASRQ